MSNSTDCDSVNYGYWPIPNNYELSNKIIKIGQFITLVGTVTLIGVLYLI